MNATQDAELGDKWDHFTSNSPNRRAQEPQVSIRPNGVLCFLQETVKHYDLENYEYVKYYWDEELRKVGIEFLDSEDDYTVELGYNSADEYIAPFSKFLTAHDLKPDKTTRFEVERFDNEEDFMVINITSFGIVEEENRKRQ